MNSACVLDRGGKRRACPDARLADGYVFTKSCAKCPKAVYFDISCLTNLHFGCPLAWAKGLVVQPDMRPAPKKLPENPYSPLRSSVAHHGPPTWNPLETPWKPPGSPLEAPWKPPGRPLQPLEAPRNPCLRNRLRFSTCASPPCARAMRVFSAAFPSLTDDP